MLLINDTIINPDHVAYAERNINGVVTLHMALNCGGGDSRLGAWTQHAILTFTGAEASSIWEQLKENAKER